MAGNTAKATATAVRRRKSVMVSSGVFGRNGRGF
jgi:hypothetical protein